MQARKRGDRPAKLRMQLPESVKKPLEHVTLIAAVGAGISLAIILFIVLSGYLAAPIVRGTALDTVTRNVNLAKDAFLWCLWLAVIAAMIRHYRAESTGWIAGLIGLGCWAILPLIIRSKSQATTAQELRELGQSLVSAFQTSGGALVVVGILRVAVGRIIALASPARVAARFGTQSAETMAIAAERVSERPSLMRRCWELHFCRTSLRSNCPRLLEGTSCWKKRSGCYCDQGLATRLLTGVGADSRAKVAEELEVAQRRARSQARRRQKQKAPCGECPVYLEHQKYKYRVVSWCAYPAAAAIIGLAVASIHAAYRWLEVELGSTLAQFQILPHTLDERPLDQVAWLSAENGAVLLLGVLLVGVILQLTELAIFRLKL